MFSQRCLALVLLASAVSATPLHQPHRLSYEDLVSDKPEARAQLLEAMEKVGLVSITGIQSSFDEAKDKALSWKFHECTQSNPDALSHTFPDGTVRTTVATYTVPGPGGIQKIEHDKTEACQSFVDASDAFRHAAAEVTDLFAQSLGSMLDTRGSLLMTKNGFDFETFHDVVDNGEHLEHFHSYQRVAEPQEKQVDTIDLHTDQGLFIVFTPGKVVAEESNRLDDGFYVELEDGAIKEVAFDEEDDLVIMLGDGVNQFVNSRIKDESRRLRAVPHSLAMPGHKEHEARVWYGRMVLPPSSALTTHQGEEEMTYGELRKLMISGSSKGLDLGCSASSELAARQLEETVCEGNTVYCWHRCMNGTDYGVSEEICNERGLLTGEALRFECINPREQVYVEGHGDFFPACTSSVEPASDYPPLPGWPREESLCTPEAWEAYSSSDGYEHSFERLGDNRGNRGYWEGAHAKGGNVTKFHWNVVGDEIEGKLVFNGIFGWIALGFSYPEGRHNGMNGASIIMGVPGGNYSAKFGLDLSHEENVQEYVIDLQGSSFRHWSDPLPGRDVSKYAVDSHECFTSLMFKTDNINDIKFNVDGTDDLVWAANSYDAFSGYHGRGRDDPYYVGDRDRFIVDWKNGAAWYPEEAIMTDIVTADEFEGDEESGTMPPQAEESEPESEPEPEPVESEDEAGAEAESDEADEADEADATDESESNAAQTSFLTAMLLVVGSVIAFL